MSHQAMLRYDRLAQISTPEASSRSAETDIRPRDLIWLALVLLAYFLLMLGSRALNVPDEGRYSDIANEMMLTHEFITPKLDGVVFFHKPILFYWLQIASMTVFGVSEWSVRLMPALFGVLGCLMTYVAATRLYGHRAGIVAAVVLAANPLYYLASHYANMDLEVSVLISGALFSFMLGMQHPAGRQRRNQLWLGYAFAALAVLTKGLIGIVLPALVVLSWMTFTRRWRLLSEIYLPSGMLIFSLIALPWYVAVQLRNPEFFHFFFIDQQFNRFTGSGFNNIQPAWFYLPVLLLGFFPWTTVLLPAAWQAARAGWKTGSGERAFFLLAWMGIVTLFFSVPQSKLLGYILPALPAMAVLTGVAVVRWLETRPGRSTLRATLYASCASGLLLAAVLLIGREFVPHRYQSEYTGVYLPVMAGALAAAVALSYWLLRKRRTIPALCAVTSMGAVFIFFALSLAGSYSLHSVKPLALLLKPHLKSDDVLVAFKAFYSDLDLYLEPTQDVLVVNDWDDPAIARKDDWKSDLYFGMQAHGRQDWMINEADFGSILQQDRRLFVLASTDKVSELETRYRLVQVAQANGIALLTNRPADLESSRPAS